MSFLKSGFIAPGIGLRPTWAADATKPATRQTTMTGSAASMTCWPTSMNSVPMPFWLTTCGVFDQLEDLDHGQLALLHDLRAEGVQRHDRGQEDGGAVDVLRARDLALLARVFLFFGVAFSVLSLAMALGHATFRVESAWATESCS